MPGISERERRIREDRANVWNEQVAVMEKLDKGETITTEDRKAYDDREVRLSELQKDLEMVQRHQRTEAAKDEQAAERGVSRDQRDGQKDPYSEAFSAFLKRGLSGLNEEQRGMLEGESRVAALDASALQTAGAGVTTAGGYLIPQGFWNNLQIALKAYGGLLQYCNVIPTDSGAPMPWPTNDPTSIVGTYITEGQGAGFQDYVFGQGMLFAWTMTSNVILASIQIIQDSAFDVDSFVNDRAGEAIGRLVAQELHTGAGSASRALTGVHTANAALGVPRVFQPAAGASDKVFTLGSPSTAITPLAAGAGGTTSLVSFNSIAGMVRSVDPAYRAGARAETGFQGAPGGGACRWVMNDLTLTQLRIITDGFGHPLWQPNPQQGEADMLWGFPYLIDQNMPNVSSSVNVVGGLWFGDFHRAMVVRQVQQAGLTRLTERYADFLQVGYIVHVRMDSQPNDMRAVVEYKVNPS